MPRLQTANASLSVWRQFVDGRNGHETAAARRVRIRTLFGALMPIFTTPPRNAEHGDRDVLADVDGFVFFATEYEHGKSLRESRGTRQPRLDRSVLDARSKKQTRCQSARIVDFEPQVIATSNLVAASPDRTRKLASGQKRFTGCADISHFGSRATREEKATNDHAKACTEERRELACLFTLLTSLHLHGFGGEVAISTTSVSVPVFSMPCSHQEGK